MRLTVLFNDPYWIGVLEVERDHCLYAATHIFGPEPSDQVVYEFVSRDLLALQARMTLGVPIEASRERHTSPKRVQREVRKQVAQQGIASKAQEAMRLQIEQDKQSRHQTSREQREAVREHKREIARARAKAKHRGH